MRAAIGAQSTGLISRGRMAGIQRPAAEFRRQPCLAGRWHQSEPRGEHPLPCGASARPVPAPRVARPTHFAGYARIPAAHARYSSRIENEHTVEQMEELMEDSSTRHYRRTLNRMKWSATRPLHNVHPPDVVIMHGGTREARHWLTGHRIALIRQFLITVDGVGTAGGEAPCTPSCSRTGTALNEVIPLTHSQIVTPALVRGTKLRPLNHRLRASSSGAMVAAWRSSSGAEAGL